MGVAVSVRGGSQDIGKRNARCELDGIIRPAPFDDALVALTEIDLIGVIAFAAAQRVVARTAGNRVVVECAPDIVGAGRSGEIGQSQEVRAAQPRPICELEPLDLRAVLDIGGPGWTLRQHVLDREAARPVREAEGEVVMAVAVGVRGDREKIGQRDACRKPDRIVGTTALDNELVALILVDEVEVTARSAFQRVIARAAGDCVIEIGAADVVGTGRSRKIGQAQKVGSAQPSAVGKLEPLDLRRVVDVGVPGRALRQHVLDREGTRSIGKAEGQIVMAVAVGIGRHGEEVRERDAAREADRVIGPAGLDDAVVALVLVDQVEVVTRAAGHRVVAVTTHQDVAARTAGEGIVSVIANGGPGLREAQRLAGAGSFKELPGFQGGGEQRAVHVRELGGDIGADIFEVGHEQPQKIQRTGIGALRVVAEIRDEIGRESLDIAHHLVFERIVEDVLERRERAEIGRVSLLIDDRPRRLRQEARHRVVFDLIIGCLKIIDLIVFGRCHDDVLWREVVHTDAVILPHELFEKRERCCIHIGGVALAPELRKLIGPAVRRSHHGDTWALIRRDHKSPETRVGFQEVGYFQIVVVQPGGELGASIACGTARPEVEGFRPRCRPGVGGAGVCDAVDDDIRVVHLPCVEVGQMIPVIGEIYLQAGLLPPHGIFDIGPVGEECVEIALEAGEITGAGRGDQVLGILLERDVLRHCHPQVGNFAEAAQGG